MTRRLPIRSLPIRRAASSTVSSSPMLFTSRVMNSSTVSDVSGASGISRMRSDAVITPAISPHWKTASLPFRRIMVRAASLISRSGQILMSGYDITWLTFVAPISRPPARIFESRSRSVTIPIGVPYCMTIRLPICFSPICFAASAMMVSGVVMATSLLMISSTFRWRLYSL